MKTFTASSLLALATQLLSIGANPVPAAEANKLVARTCDCTAYNNAIIAKDQNAAANAISSCEPLPQPLPPFSSSNAYKTHLKPPPLS